MSVDNAVPCKSCGHSNRFIEDRDTGDIVCTGCGMVAAAQMPSDEQEWRGYMEEGNVDDYARADTYKNDILQDRGLDTNLNFDDVGDSVDFDGIKKYSSHSRYSQLERKLLRCYSILQEYSDQLSVTDNIVKRAYSIINECFKHNGFKAKNNHLLCATCIYIACRQCHALRLLQEISITSDYNSKEIISMYKQILQTTSIHVPIASDEDYINRYCYILALPHNISDYSLKVNDSINSLSILPHTSTALSAVSVFFTCYLFNVQPTVTLHHISLFAAKTSRVLKTMYFSLYKSKDEIVFDAFKDELAKGVITQVELLKMLDRLPSSISDNDKNEE
ncbi:hypothetical protein WA158_004506 [Blastocystis sp. Blastoise]